MIYRCARFIYALHALYYRPTDANAEKTMRAAKRCGAIGIKLLQFLVSIEGFILPEAKDKFTDVFDKCECHSWEETLAMYKEDFDMDMHEDFILLDSHFYPSESESGSGSESKSQSGDAEIPVPIGSGSIGQVYKLYHKGLNTEVAVKVKHPGIDASADDFMKSISKVIYLIECFVTVPFMFLVKEFISNVHVQLNYFNEVENIRTMHRQFADEPTIVIPEVHSYSSRFIIMSFHDGLPYSQITDPRLRVRISLDVYLFMLRGVVNHDFIHCDLHIGNWRVIPGSIPKLIIYDFGLTTSTGSLDLNKRIMLSMYEDNFMKLAEIMMPTIKTKKCADELLSYIKFIKTQTFESRHAEYNMLIRKASSLGVPFNLEIIRAIQGLSICENILSISRSKFLKTLGKQGNRKEVVLCYLSGVLAKLNKYPDLKASIDSWIAEDPNMRKVFEDWLFDSFGHRDGSVYIDIILDGPVI
jgi:predicted unusual protein kinase regulating ubiquinone biosynthesis (AarF/ABC1/UbiB family)